MSTAEELTIEEQAKAQGWKPDYDGPGAKTAEQFVEDGKKIAPIQKERNDKLMREIADLKKSHEDFKKEFKQTHMASIHATKKHAYEQAVSDLKKKQLEAVEEADTAKFNQIENEIKQLEKPEMPNEDQPKAKVTPEFIDWNAKNEWYNKDDEMTAYAESYGARIVNEFDHNTPEGRNGFLKKIEAGVKKVFPENFGSKSSNVSDVETPSGGASKKSGKGYKDLPADCKSAADKFVSQGLYKTKEEYAKFYWENVK